jgi:hypothetical protein
MWVPYRDRRVLSAGSRAPARAAGRGVGEFLRAADGVEADQNWKYTNGVFTHTPSSSTPNPIP